MHRGYYCTLYMVGLEKRGNLCKADDANLELPCKNALARRSPELRGQHTHDDIASITPVVLPYLEQTVPNILARATLVPMVHARLASLNTMPI